MNDYDSETNVLYEPKTKCNGGFEKFGNIQ